MSRPVSTPARQSVYAQETGEVWLALLTIDSPEIDPPIRVVRNGTDISSRGDVYTAYPFEISLPLDSGEELSRTTLVIDNVDRQIVQAVREASAPPTARLELVLASSPDLVEAGPFDFTLRSARYSAPRVEGTLVYEDILTAPYPAGTFTPNDFPGLFS